MRRVHIKKYWSSVVLVKAMAFKHRHFKASKSGHVIKHVSVTSIVEVIPTAAETRAALPAPLGLRIT